jgi:hypothetical protein
VEQEIASQDLVALYYWLPYLDSVVLFEPSFSCLDSAVSVWETWTSFPYLD